MKSLAPILVAAALIGACSPGGRQGGAEPPMTVQRLDSALANYYRYNSALEDSARHVVRSRDEWTALWNRIVANHEPKPAVPDIDFEKEMLLVAAMGTRATGGYSIEIEAVDRDSSAITVSVRGRSPGRNCATTQALTAPVDIVRIPRSDHPVRFVEETIVTNCP
jgi:hypothetical protein